jgi:succinate dehydrogenase / fumarate reductase cytochrome b subunit
MSSVASSSAVNRGTWVGHFLRSSVGAKIVMALSGAVMFGFIIGHMAGNLQIFLGQEAYNAYAHFLKTTPALLWGTRAAILGAVLLHIASGLRLTRLNKAARPREYVRTAHINSTAFSRTMALSGVVVLLFIVYHLLHFTLGITNPELFNLTDEQGRHDVFTMFVSSFQQLPIAIAYILANVFLGMHLVHGAKSMFQSLGLNHPKYNPLFTIVAPGIGLLVVAGNVFLPIAAMAGLCHPLGAI